LLQHQKQQLHSCCNTRNINCLKWVKHHFATAGTPETTMAWREQQPSKDRQNSILQMLTQHDQQLSRIGKTQLQLLRHQEQHEFTKSAAMVKKQRIVQGFQGDG